MRQRKIFRKGEQTGFVLEQSEFLDYNEFSELSPELQIQYLTPKQHFVPYVSRKIVRVSKYKEAARNFVLRFKEGNHKDTVRAASMVADFIVSESLNTNEYTFMCIPASTPDKQAKRYAKFISMVCRRTSNLEGFDLVQVVSERNEVHAGGSRSVVNYEISHNVRGKKIILFDDVETTGITFAKFAAQLETMGAEVVQGIFLAVAEPF